MIEEQAGREPIQIVEIVQKKCQHTYGVAPCTASGATGEECFNTRFTCQDVENYSAVTASELSLFFCRGYVGEQAPEIDGIDYLIPSLKSVSTTPTRINLTAADPDAKGLGNRAVLTVTFNDHSHSDQIVDPYVNTRPYNPRERGTFWTKWLIRNKFRYNFTIRVYEGYVGQALADMSKRSFIITDVTGPTARNEVTIKGKDLLARIEERKAQAPVASRGELETDILAAATEFPVVGAALADYDASGLVRIGDEIIAYSSIAEVGNTLVFTVSERGAEGTVADDHTVEDTVQLCLKYDNKSPDFIAEDLLKNYGNVPVANINTTLFASEADNYLSLYDLTVVISEPVAVTQLLSELQVECGFLLWWNERTALIDFKAVRGVTEDPPLITSEEHILAGSFSITEMPRSRISQVWFHYNLKDPTLSLSSGNYRSIPIIADLPSEGEDQYGEASVRTIFSRWINSSALALNTMSKIISRYAVVPRKATFAMDAKDRTHWVGDTIRISHFRDVDQFGERQIKNWTIISAEEIKPGDVVQYTVEDTSLYGLIGTIQANTATDYTPGDDLYLGWIGDANGLLSDGNNCTRTS